jgi:phosphoribosylformylglycinamidine cyclo-ligase
MKKTTYKSSGVDIDAANRFVRSIGRSIKSTHGPNVLSREGAFGSLFRLNAGQYKKPVLVSSTDGVGTKLLVAKTLGRHDTVGIDLVAMNVNDLLCVGAEPLFFLDYIACGRLDGRVLKDVVKGIAKGCRQASCSLVGGETAEMPGMYKKGDYDLAGFAVGVVEEEQMIDGSGIRAGDRVIGLPSSGLHSNGYSFVRKILSASDMKRHAKEILKPTRIYASEVKGLRARCTIKGIAHITGGAYYDKMTKVLPEGLCFAIKKNSWKIPEIFNILERKGKVDEAEMYRTFNMGIGMVLVVAQKDSGPARAWLKRQRIRSYDIGEVTADKNQKIVFI